MGVDAATSFRLRFGGLTCLELARPLLHSSDAAKFGKTYRKAQRERQKKDDDVSVCHIQSYSRLDRSPA